ncbi:MAG TPA: ATP-binding cassette domain-containing protein, partial [Anaerolineae bacterium]|nr:ATP-binding cassette domain-containing protein [Anaerolineae bacterium]
MRDQIVIRGARLHNLKNVTLSIPKGKLVVFTGLSGSGKSTLAFDLLHREGQRQYMESLGLVTHEAKPQAESLVGLSPSISVDQHLTNHSPRSTVGTVTEVYTYLRVLYARIGHRPCPHCGGDVPPAYDRGNGEAWDDDDDGGDDVHSTPCPRCGTALPEIGMAHFSFNKLAGACPTCTGLGVVQTANVAALLDETRSIEGGGVLRWDAKYEIPRYAQTLQRAAEHYGFTFDPAAPIGSLGAAQRDLLLYGVGSPQFRRRFPDIDPPETAAAGRFEGIVTGTLRRYEENIHKVAYREKMEKLLVTRTCPDCGGDRLRPESRRVTVL